MATVESTARPAGLVVRPYRDTDRAALYDICVRTAHQGGDSREIYPDLELMPSIFADPYAYLEPELTCVLDNGERAVGYILGTADTMAFVEAYRERWLPTLRDRYPAPTGEPETPTQQMIILMHHPERMILPELAAYPAHLYIDVLPEYQGAGHGRALMHAFLAALHGAGVPAAHPRHGDQQHRRPRLLRPAGLSRGPGPRPGAADLPRPGHRLTGAG